MVIFLIHRSCYGLGATVLGWSCSVPTSTPEVTWQFLKIFLVAGAASGGWRPGMPPFYNARANIAEQSKISTMPRAEKPWPGRRLLAPQKHSTNTMVHKGKLPQLPIRKYHLRSYVQRRLIKLPGFETWVMAWSLNPIGPFWSRPTVCRGSPTPMGLPGIVLVLALRGQVRLFCWPRAQSHLVICNFSLLKIKIWFLHGFLCLFSHITSFHGLAPGRKGFDLSDALHA